MKMIRKEGTNVIDDIVCLDYTNHLFRTSHNGTRVNKYISTNKTTIGYCDIFMEDSHTYIYVFYIQNYNSNQCINIYSNMYYNFRKKLTSDNNTQINKIHIVFVYPVEVKERDVIRLTENNYKDSVFVSEIFLSNIVSNDAERMEFIKNSIANNKNMSSYYIVAATLLPLTVANEEHKQELINDILNKAKSLYDVKMKHLITKELIWNMCRFSK